MIKSNLLVITPVKHIKGIYLEMSKNFNIFYYPYLNKISKKINTEQVDFIYTNPNKSKIYLGKSFIDSFPNLKCVCTASTGTTHIDKKYLLKKNIKLISLTKEIKTLKKISSTSELAVTFSLMAIRNISNAINSVRKREWDYEKYIGRQLNSITIGIVGYGRLGKIYYNLMKNFGSSFLIYDPYKKIKQTKNLSKINNLSNLFKKCDIVTLHVHVNEKTTKMINKQILKNANKNIIIINTSRGELINEDHIMSFLKKNKKAQLYVDVLNDEINNKFNSKIFKYFIDKNNYQVIISPHIGGMTFEAQEIAYSRALELLKNYDKNINEKRTTNN